jgi:hypothetical protein
MTERAADLARRLGEHAEAVCRHYLSNGKRSGRYWIVGDVRAGSGKLDTRDKWNFCLRSA